ncbi:hypothetical protein A3Q56_03251 [Intoshia linei]|uniref:CUB domain-containing protein n=1 Tax=Intoshia linei TaxID=1819745 RepID=A0A177B4B6_9BILA|nr:hypothetical protein A3Q56_03251 [Intoshia linei]
MSGFQIAETNNEILNSESVKSEIDSNKLESVLNRQNELLQYVKELNETCTNQEFFENEISHCDESEKKSKKKFQNEDNPTNIGIEYIEQKILKYQNKIKNKTISYQKTEKFQFKDKNHPCFDHYRYSNGVAFKKHDKFGYNQKDSNQFESTIVELIPINNTGWIKSPNFPFKYPHNVNIKYRIKLNFLKNNLVPKICWLFRAFSMENTNYCTYDYLKINNIKYCGNGTSEYESNDELSKNYDPSQNVWNLCHVVQTKYVDVVFHTDNSNSQTGFYAKYIIFEKKPNLQSIIPVTNYQSNDFVCFDRKKTLSFDHVCNGIVDCDDGSDEDNYIVKCGEENIFSCSFKQNYMNNGWCGFVVLKGNWNRSQNDETLHDEFTYKSNYIFTNTNGKIRSRKLNFKKIKPKSCLTLYYYVKSKLNTSGTVVTNTIVSIYVNSNNYTDYRNSNPVHDRWIPININLLDESFLYITVNVNIGNNVEFISFDEISLSSDTCIPEYGDLMPCTFDKNSCNWISNGQSNNGHAILNKSNLQFYTLPISYFQQCSSLQKTEKYCIQIRYKFVGKVPRQCRKSQKLYVNIVYYSTDKNNKRIIIRFEYTENWTIKLVDIISTSIFRMWLSFIDESNSPFDGDCKIEIDDVQINYSNCKVNVPCPENYHSCDNNTMCLEKNVICDGTFDCLDKTDEYNCILDSQPIQKIEEKQVDFCPPNNFQCSSGKCISNIFVCDGKNDCSDTSDESQYLGCNLDLNFNKIFNVTCSKGFVRCSTPEDNGQFKCVNEWNICDGIFDCFDRSDEIFNGKYCSEIDLGKEEKKTKVSLFYSLGAASLFLLLAIFTVIVITMYKKRNKQRFIKSVGSSGITDIVTSNEEINHSLFKPKNGVTDATHNESVNPNPRLHPYLTNHIYKNCINSNLPTLPFNHSYFSPQFKPPNPFQQNQTPPPPAPAPDSGMESLHNDPFKKSKMTLNLYEDIYDLPTTNFSSLSIV